MDNIFGTDGVRGKYDNLHIGKYNISLFANAITDALPFVQKIVIASDTRASCQIIVDTLNGHFSSHNIDIINLGVMPTSAVSLFVPKVSADLGLMISASHNPYFDNGIKVFASDGLKINFETEKLITNSYFRLSNDKILTNHKSSGSQISIQSDYQNDFIEALFSKFDIAKLSANNQNKLTIVCDLANGSYFELFEKALSKLGHKLIVKNNNPDGKNINDNCGSLYPELLSNDVISNSANFCIALDGDGDRIAILDERGEMIDGDNLLCGLALHLQLQNKFLNKVVVSKLANQAMIKFLNQRGIEVIIEDVGDKKILARMIRDSANIGGEPSGHILITNYLNSSDGLVITLIIIEMISLYGKKVSEMFGNFKPNPSILYSHSLINDDQSYLKNKIDAINNLAKQFPDSHFLVRKSGTENKLRILIESSSVKLNDECLSEVLEILNA